MTQKEKELLLTDLCTRLPYKVECEAILNNGGSYPCVLDIGALNWYISGDHVLKPYLRPMSSMTEEEHKEAKENGCIIYQDTSPKNRGILVIASPKGIDWLNKNMFDYRKDDEGKAMIEKGLALEAPEGMYNN